MNLNTAVVLIAFGVTILQAETLDVKLGLWEVTHTSQTNGMPPIDTSKMTPEQRARVEARMKEMQTAKPETMTQKTCLTKEQLEKSLFLGKDEDAACKRNVVSTARTVTVKMECAGKQKTTTEMNFQALSRENVKGTMRMTMGDGAHTMTVNSTLTAKWLGPACGDVK